MTHQLTIDKITCTKCGRCVRVCPVAIFVQKEVKGEVSMLNEKNCVVCGHCVSACPGSSISHTSFPIEKKHVIDRSILPKSEQIMALCKSRRSNRAFSPDPIPLDELQLILEAAHCAPTANNMQEVEYTLITDPQKLRKIVKVTMRILSSVSRRYNNIFFKPFLKLILPPTVNAQLLKLKRLQKEYKKGNDPILRGATSLLLVHTPKGYRFGNEDANLAYQNASLMAESLGVSQFYTGFIRIAIQYDKAKRIEKLLNIKGNIYAGMALGIPEFKFPYYVDRKELKVNLFTPHKTEQAH